MQLSERRVLLLVGDVLVASVATLVALGLWTLTSGEVFSLAYLQLQQFWFPALVLPWILLNAGLYDLRRAASMQATLGGLMTTAGVAIGIYLGVYFLSPRDSLPRLVVLYFIAGTFLLELTWRVSYIALLSRSFYRRALVVGAGWAGETIIRELVHNPASHHVIAGVIDDDRRKHGRAIEGVPVLGGHECLLEAARTHRASDIILAITAEVRGAMFQALLECQERSIDIVRMSLLYEQLTGRVPIQHLNADWMLSSFADTVRLNNLSRAFRRMVDLVGGAAGLLLLGLIYPWVAAAIWLESRGPVLYRQVRLGRGGRRFEIVKFRTMAPDAEADGEARWADRNDSRITGVGRFLRRTRLDEVPQFWNVFKGEMGLVGPRPERPEFVATLETQVPFYRTRLLVKPGITGWAQVSYGYGGSEEDAAIKLEYDLYYIKHRSIWLDLIILARTIGVMSGFKGT